MNQPLENIKIAIFASGKGSNAYNIISHLKNNANLHVSLIVTDKTSGSIHDLSQKNNIPIFVVPKNDIITGNELLTGLQKHQIDFIVLAGYLKKIPKNVLDVYSKNAVNIHPALLPKYGGEGMYGMRVHMAVIENKETESGITIHYVDEIYDNGEIILQKKCIVSENDTAETLAEKIHQLEYKYYPELIASLLKTKSNVKKSDAFS